MDYKQFLESKKVEVKSSGFEVNKDKLNPMLFEWQKDIVYWALKKGKAALFEDCGLGKGQPYGSKVLTINGWKNIEDLIIGDKVISSDGNPYNVTGVYPKGELPTYRLYFSDGVSFVVDEEHLHILRTNNDRQRGKPWRVMSTKEILVLENLRYGENGKSRNYDIPVVKPIEFKKQELYINPYLMGCLLGDGGIRANSILTTSDKEILNRCDRELPEGFKFKHISRFDYRIVKNVRDNVKSEIRIELENLGLFDTKSHNKFIPKKYLINSIDNRVNLLKGLMDTDGYVMKCGTCQFYSVSERLAKDVLNLVRSLGGIPTFSKKKAFLKRKRHRDCYIVTFSLKIFNPFYLKRKRERWNSNPRDNGRWIDRIEYEKIQKTVCISVDSPDHSYVTEHFIVTHNTPQQLEWAKQVHQHTGGNVLVLAPLAVSKQTKREGEKFNIETHICRTQDDVKPGINITNYEMLERFNPDKFTGIVLDESSILKSFTGKIRTQIIETFNNTPYRLSCTATPAPNDYMELGNQSEFLGVMSRTEMLSTFFVHDGGNTSKWRLKGHAEDKFWEWVASWAVVIGKPSDLGYDDGDFILPKLNMFEHIVEVDEIIEMADGQLSLIANVAQTLNERRAARRNSMEGRVKRAAELANNSNEQWLVWCDLNAESEMLRKAINEAVEVKGSDKNEHKENAMIEFAEGNIKTLVTKPSIAGWGMNWQNCHNMIFVGLSDSYEMLYQAIRRCWRFGQDHPVNVHIVIGEQEGAVKANIERKEKDYQKMFAEMVKHTKDILSKEIHGTMRISEEYEANKNMKIPQWLKEETA
jgi:hypothetical protein